MLPSNITKMLGRGGWGTCRTNKQVARFVEHAHMSVIYGVFRGIIKLGIKIKDIFFTGHFPVPGETAHA